MRELSELEKEIVKKKERRMGKIFDIKYIEYHPLFPRTTLCCISKVAYPKISEATFGATLKSRHDKDNPSVGEVVSFVRALNSYKPEQTVILEIPELLIM